MTTQIEWKKRAQQQAHTHTRKIAVKKEEQTNKRDFPKKIKRRSNNIGRSPFWIEILIHVAIVFFLLLLLSMVCGPTEREKNLSIFGGAVVVAKSNCFDHFSFVFMMEICQPFPPLSMCVSTWTEFILFVYLLVFSPATKGAPNGNEKSKKLLFSLSLHFLCYIGYLHTKSKQALRAAPNNI